MVMEGGAVKVVYATETGNSRNVGLDVSERLVRRERREKERG